MKPHPLSLRVALAWLVPAIACAAPTVSVLHSFKGGRDGAIPLPGSGTGLVADGSGALYGVTAGLDVTTDLGTVFKLTPPAPGQTKWIESVLYHFKGGTDGDYPAGSLLSDGGGGYYSTTVQGGAGTCSALGTPAGCGTVYHLAPPAAGKIAWTEKVIYRFQGGNDGSAATGNVIADASGNLYGLTSVGGTGACNLIGPGCGTVYRLTPPAAGSTTWTETVLYSFQGGNDGNVPEAGLTMDSAGALYGTTSYGGGGGCGGIGCGLVFKLSPPSPGQTNWTETVLYSFQAGLDGAFPQPPPVFDSAGALLGTTQEGGSLGNGGNGFGTIYRLTPPKPGHTAWTESVLYPLQGGTDGAFPNAGLTPDGSNAFVTTTYYGGTGPCAFSFAPTGCGTVIKVAASASAGQGVTESVLYSLPGGDVGALPGGNLYVDAAGVIYGAAEDGGTGSCVSFVPGCGTVFSLVP